MSDENTTLSSTAESGTKTVQNKHAYYSKINAIRFYDDNRAGKSAYLNGQESEKGIEINPECARNAITGRAYRGLSQLVIQNSSIKEKEFITYEQALKAGTFIKKGSKEAPTPSVVITIPKEKDKETGEWKPDVIRLFPKTAAANIGAIELAKLDSERLEKISVLRAKNEKEQDPEKREKTVIAIAHEHLKALDYAEAIGNRIGDDFYRKALDLSPEKIIEDKEKRIAFIKKNIRPEEMKVLEGLQQDRTVPTFEQLCGRAVVESRNNDEYMEKLKAEKGKAEIDAKDCHSAADFLGKYLAATTMEARFITDKESVKAVQQDISKKLEAEYNKDNYDSAFELCKEASSRCKEDLSAFRTQSREQQLGIGQTVEKEIVQERPEQDIGMSL